MPFDQIQYKNLFEPKRMAIIGASAKAGKVGNAIVKNILDGGYQGEIIPVNPKKQQVYGLETVADVNEIDDPVDLAVVVVAARFVPQVLESCGKKQITSIVVITAGFKEMASEEGISLQQQLLEISRKYNQLLIGPNCLGIVNTEISLNATFSRSKLASGNIAFVSQSGAIGIHALEFARKHDIGFSKFVTIGNKAVANENDLIEYLYNDPQTKVILVYLESFADGISFREVVKHGKRKPLIMLKSGRSERGQQAARSHTGALASSDNMISYFLKDCGVVRVDTMEEMFTTAMVMANQPSPGGPAAGVLTNAGGLGIMAADAAEKYGLALKQIDEKTAAKLKSELPAAAALSNPVDILGDADASRYVHALDILVETDLFEMLIIICTPQFMTDREKILQDFTPILEKARKKGLSVVANFPESEDDLVTLFNQLDLPNYEFPELAVKACANYYQMEQYLKLPGETYTSTISESQSNAISKTLKEANEVGYLNEKQSYEVFETYNLPVARYAMVQTSNEAIEEGEKIGFPLVAKIVAEGVIHKFDIGGVIVNIQNADQLEKAFKKLSGLVSKKLFSGVLLQEMVAGGIELIIGAKKHPGFGHAIMFGLGGTYVEVMEDVCFAMAPLSQAKAVEMINSIKGVKMLNGFRGKPPVNKQQLVELVLKLSRIVCDFPEIKSLDLNPVFATENEVVIADARILL